jgi:hypothetical protein
MLIVDIEDVVKKALEELKINQLISDFEKHEQKITEALKKAAQKEATLITKMFHMIDNINVREVEKEMLAIIGDPLVDLIKKSFYIETYRMKVVNTPDGQTTVHVHRGGIEFQPKRVLKVIDDIKKSEELQRASVVIELIFFLCSCVNIKADQSKVELKATVEAIKAHVSEPQFTRALNTFVKAWNQAGYSAWGKANAMFNFLKETYSLQIFWKLIKVILQNLSTLENIKAIGEIVLMIVAAFATDGVALIARIVLAVDNAVYLEQKIANLGSFSHLKKTMP